MDLKQDLQWGERNGTRTQESELNVQHRMVKDAEVKREELTPEMLDESEWNLRGVDREQEHSRFTDRGAVPISCAGQGELQQLDCTSDVGPQSLIAAGVGQSHERPSPPPILHHLPNSDRTQISRLSPRERERERENQEWLRSLSISRVRGGQHCPARMDSRRHSPRENLSSPQLPVLGTPDIHRRAHGMGSQNILEFNDTNRSSAFQLAHHIPNPSDHPQSPIAELRENCSLNCPMMNESERSDDAARLSRGAASPDTR